jgi:putative flippase GtrA
MWTRLLENDQNQRLSSGATASVGGLERRGPVASAGKASRPSLGENSLTAVALRPSRAHRRCGAESDDATAAYSQGRAQCVESLIAGADRRRAGRLRAEQIDLTGQITARWTKTPRFVRNGLISLPTFLIDLAMLYGLVRRLHLDYRLATILAFLVANGLSYLLARRLVFEGSRRGWKSGFVYFLGIAALSAFTLTPLMWLFVEGLHIEFVVSRVVAAAIVGVGGYLLNLVFNFRIAADRDDQAIIE